uniref:Uncharacterized protein n=1 Tax=Phytophthora ramorum TaxID=164328 RepID=H3GV14_PHYRM
MVSETTRAHSQLQAKHALLKDEHADMKNKPSKLQEEHAELHHERNDQEGDTWLWIMQHDRLQAKYKKLQAEHSRWKAACASLVEEVEHKVLAEEYLVYLAQEYGHTHWPVAKVAELERRQLAEAHELAKEREQALMDKVAALESEVVAIEAIEATSKRKVAKLNSAIKQMCAGITKSHLSSKETTDRLAKELAEANKTLCSQMTTLHNSAKTAVARREAAASSKKLLAVQVTKSVAAPTPTQQRCTWELELMETMERLQKMELKLSEETTVQSRTTSKSAVTPVALLKKHVKLTAPTQQPEETMSAAAKGRFGWACNTKRSGSTPSPTSSSPQLSRRSAA